jgi:hypothetical protein
LKTEPSQLRPFLASGEPKVAGAKAISRFRRLPRSGSAANHERTTSMPVECTIASKGSSAPRPPCVAKARSKASARSLMVTSLFNET